MDPMHGWETEALRESMSRRSGPPRPSLHRTPRMDGDLVTLREAEERTGIPVNTLRKWARRGTIDSHLEQVGDVTLRMVSMRSVQRRAEALGRPATAPPSSAAPPASTATDAPAEPPPGTMLVPVDAWNKMLGQLGNLHEAGQRLAEARERAAKAETEARFLRERLAELRERLEAAEAARAEATGAAPSPPAPEPAPPDPSPTTEPVWRYMLTGLRRRRR